jgi:hypothetical protein
VALRPVAPLARLDARNGPAALSREKHDLFRRLRQAAAVGAVRLDDPVGMDRYDLVVVGSDEVWNVRHPWFGGEPLFFGENLKADRLAAYAASAGNHDGLALHLTGWPRR